MQNANTHLKPKPILHADWIHPAAYEVVEILQSEGFETYLVGGCVRDLLAGIPPKDFDIATNALPNQVRRNISNAYVIGKRFRLVLVRRGLDTFEVATFRRAPTAEELRLQESATDGAPFGDNFFGKPEDDAKRRDFTINSMFYDPVHGELLDHCQGQVDIENRCIRTIGVPHVRMVEDPIRILRALRLAHKLRFRIDPALRESMQKDARELTKSVLPRRREEYIKLLKLSEPDLAFREGQDLGLWAVSLPYIDKLLQDPDFSELFFHHLQLLPGSDLNFGEPTEVLAGLLYAVIRSRGIEPGDASALRRLENQDDFINFCKNELGVFNLELRNILTAFELQKELSSIDDFQKRGHRRQSGFLRNEALPIALKFCSLDFQLSAHQLNFWSEAMERVPAKS